VVVPVRGVSCEPVGFVRARAQECGNTRIQAGARGMYAQFVQSERVTFKFEQAGNTKLKDRNHFVCLCLLDVSGEKVFGGTDTFGSLFVSGRVMCVMCVTKKLCGAHLEKQMSWNFTSAVPNVTYPVQQQARNVQQTVTECTVGCLHVIKCADFRGNLSATNVTIQNLSVQNLSALSGSFGSLSSVSGSFGSLSSVSGSFGSLSVNNFYNESLSNMSYVHWEAIQNTFVSASNVIPHANFYSTVSQSAVANDTLTIVSFNEQPIVNSSFLQLLSSGTRIYSQVSGTLNVDFTYQFYNGGGGGSADLVTVWLQKNGSTLSNSGNSIHVPTNGRDVSYSGGMYVPVNTGDFIELCWATGNHTAIRAHFISASGVYPAVPSIKCEIHYLRNA
jgi:hypothetical protein